MQDETGNFLRIAEQDFGKCFSGQENRLRGDPELHFLLGPMHNLSRYGRGGSLILVIEMIEQAALEILAAAASVRHLNALLEDAAGDNLDIRSAQALIVRNRTVVNEHLLNIMPRLTVVGRLGTGLDNIDVGALRARGITLVTGRGANAISVAEWVIGYLFMVMKTYREADASVRQGRWDRHLGGHELAGRTMGIVGMGDIGRRVARRVRALGLKVVACDPRLGPHDDLIEDGTLTVLPLPGLLEQADFVSVHVPLTPATRGLIGREEFARMKEGAYLIQTSRGGVVDEEALARALASGHLAGSLVDVLECEPPANGHPLLSQPNCVLTPHVAGLTVEARERVDTSVARSVVEVLGREAPVPS